MATAANFESVLGVNQNTATSNARRGDTGGPNTSGHNSAEKQLGQDNVSAKKGSVDANLILDSDLPFNSSALHSQHAVSTTRQKEEMQQLIDEAKVNLYEFYK